MKINRKQKVALGITVVFGGCSMLFDGAPASLVSLLISVVSLVYAVHTLPKREEKCTGL
jgi:hypothetical protein